MQHAPPASRIERLRRIVTTSLGAILTRQDDAYGWLDTKIDLRTGRDAPSDDPLRGRGAVYGWVQGRGLESLARHEAWLASQADDPEAAQLRTATRARLARLVEHTESVRRRHGRLAFLMDTRGFPMRIDAGKLRADTAEAGTSTLTDLFYVKGLVEAAACLGRDGLMSEAIALGDRVLDDIRADRLRSDQQAFDARNPVGDVAGRRTHAPRMLGLAAATRLLQLTGDKRFDAAASAFMIHLLDRHVAERGEGTLRAGDFWEFITPGGAPYRAGGVLWSDPGHAIEAAGFALRHLRVVSGERGSPPPSSVARWTAVALRNFANGFSEQGRGICKAFDLVSRRAVNPQMPWWSLPEAMRAAAEALAWPQEGRVRESLWAMFRGAEGALLNGYIREELSLMATQCLEPDGTIADAIPAVPDADPGYHTNLCLIDVMDLLARLE